MVAKVRDLTGSKVRERQRQVSSYGTMTDLSSTTVERGSTHWAEGSNVHIDGLLGVAGTATVSGVLSVTGTLNASGQINLSGSTAITGPLNVTGTTTIGGNTNITGELNVTGPTTLDGILDIGGDTTITGLLDVQGDTTMSGKLDVTGPMATKGTLSVEGVTTLKSDLNVVENAKIKAGQVEIWPDNIALESATLTSDALLGLRLAAANRKVVVESLGGQAELIGGGSTVIARSGNIDLSSPRTNISGQILATGLPNTSGSNFVPNLYIDSNGRIYRTSWAPAA